MKPNNRHNHFIDHLCKHTPNRIHQYWSELFSSKKCEKMSQGGAHILKIISWARGDNWRRNAHKSEKKYSHNKK